MLISRLRQAFARKAERIFAAPPGVRVYVIGDVHGRDDLLGLLAARIEQDVVSAPEQAITILLGDYIDRGPASNAVLERLASQRFPTRIRALRGNHEDMLLKFLREPERLEDWRRYGGLETLHAYGVDISSVMRGEGFEDARDALLAAMPQAHLQFLQSTELSLAIGDYFFCHAGVRPEIPLNQQGADDLLWIRDAFLRHERHFEKFVVHGHTPVGAPDVRANRINIDTGAFATSCLSCLVLEGTGRRFLFAGDPRAAR